MIIIDIPSNTVHLNSGAMVQADCSALAGYVFDGASVPQLFWFLFPPSYTEAWEATITRSSSTPLREQPGDNYGDTK